MSRDLGPFLIGDVRNIHESGRQIHMAGHSGDRPAAFIVGVDNDQRDMHVVFIQVAALALQAMTPLHLAVIGGEHDDSIVHHVVFPQPVQNQHEVVVRVLDAVKIIILVILPYIRVVIDASEQPPMALEDAQRIRHIRRVEFKVPC